MSKIHQALQETSPSANRRQRQNFNPLATGGSGKSGFKAGYSAVVLILLAAAALVLFWPVQPNQESTPISSHPQPATTTQPAATTQAVPDLVTESTAPVAAASTPLATQEKPTEPEAAEQQAVTLVATQPLAEQPSPEPTPSEAAIKPEQPAVEPAPAKAEDTAAKAVANVTPAQKEPVTIEAVKAEPIAKPEAKPEPAPITAIAASEPSIKPATVKQQTMQPALAKAAQPDATEANSDQPEQAAAIAEPQPVEEAVAVIQKSQAKWQKDIQNHIVNGNISQAEVQLKQWIGAIPADPTPRIWLARIYINKGLHQAAEPVLSGLKDNTEANALLGIVYEKTNRPTLAANVFEQLYRNHPENNRWLLFWAVNSENSRELAIAKTLYQNYLERFASVDAALAQFAQSRLQALGGVR